MMNLIVLAMNNHIDCSDNHLLANDQVLILKMYIFLKYASN